VQPLLQGDLLLHKQFPIDLLFLKKTFKSFLKSCQFDPLNFEHLESSEREFELEAIVKLMNE
jgi:hypothetical protein